MQALRPAIPEPKNRCFRQHGFLVFLSNDESPINGRMEKVNNGDDTKFGRCFRGNKGVWRI